MFDVCQQSRLARRAIIVGLLLVQVNLLWVAEMHTHFVAGFSPGQQLTIREGSGLQPSAAQAEFLCTICQIIRQNAARPAAHPFAPAPAVSAIFALLTDSRRLHSQQPTAIYGRAPPRY